MHHVPKPTRETTEHTATSQHQHQHGRELLKGLAAGVVATSAMVATRDLMYALEDPGVRAREEQVRAGQQVTPMQAPVRKAAEAMGEPLGKEQERNVGNALAWGLGIAGVAAYALVRRRAPVVAAGGGLAFGTVMWALEDELMMHGLGIVPAGPTEYPWQAHARGLVSHLAYGATAEAALRALDRIAQG